jgi:DNA-binding MarR family transcriptional regulator
VQASASTPADVSPKELARALLGLWGQMMRSDMGGVFALFEELDLAMTQVKTLHVLNACADELSVKELSDRLGLSLPAASRTIEGLLRRGLVERREDEHDRRVKRVSISGDGRAVVDRIAAARLDGLQAFAESLAPAQRAALHAALADLGTTPKD